MGVYTKGSLMLIVFWNFFAYLTCLVKRLVKAFFKRVSVVIKQRIASLFST
ncbi:MAG: hypothetical protein ACI9EP_000281 [Oceanospirillaceae bacterium]|jgi:hypothetical protein